MFRFACGNLFSRPVRTSLSVLGLTVAIAGMVGLFSIAGGIDHLVATTFELIPGLLVQQRGAPVPLFSNLPADWREDLEAVEGVSVVNPEVLTRVNVINGKTIVSPPRFFLGIDIESRLRLEHGVYDQHLVGGRFLSADDIGTMNCVVSREIAEEFAVDVGDALQVNGYEVAIVGIYHCGSMLLDVNVLMDLDTVRRLSRFDADSVSVFYVETTGEFDDETVSQRIEDAFVGRDLQAWSPLGMTTTIGEMGSLSDLFRGFDQAIKDAADPPASGEEEAATTHAAAAAAAVNPDSPVEVSSGDDWAERFDEFSGDLDLFLTLMTAIGVSIAVISIVNTMLMSVTERRIEFGILRANGWSAAHILQLITFESGLLGVAGGIAGSTLGWAATHVVNAIFPDRAHLHAGLGLLAFSVVFSTLLGVIGGVYPAWIAARLSPMEAIRRG